MKLESDLMKQIANRLWSYQLSGECEWWIRINAGRIKSYYGSYIRLAPTGTPDYIAIIRNRQEGLTILFMEAKSNTGKLRKEQVEFINKYDKKAGFYIMEIRDIKQLDDWIDKYAKDFVSLI